MAELVELSGMRLEEAKGGRERIPVIDVDVHELLRSERDLIPYLEEPWRGRVAAADGWKGIGGFQYSYPQIAGVAMADAATVLRRVRTMIS